MGANTLTTVYELDATRFVSGSKKVDQATASSARAINRVKGDLNSMSRMKVGFDGSDLVNIAKRATLAAAALAAASVAGAVAASRQAAEFDALVRALEAVEGSSKRAADSLEDVRQLAKLPGLGLREALQGFTGLRANQFGKDEALTILREFGNANAIAGGGREELKRVLTAIKQMSQKPFLQGEELLQLSEANIPAHRLVKDAFGTSDTEALKRAGVTSKMVIAALTAELARLPRVAGGAKNTFENLGDALDMAVVQVGTSLNESFLPVAESLVAAIEKVTDAGIFKATADSISGMIQDLLGGAGDVDAMTATLIEMNVAARVAGAGLANLLGNIQGYVEFYSKTPLGKLFGMSSLGGVAEDARAELEGQLKASEVLSRAKRTRSMLMKGATDQEIADAVGKTPEWVAKQREDFKKVYQPPEEKEGEKKKPAESNIVRALRQNTEAIERQTENLNRMVFGGGTVGGRGLSEMDLGPSRGSARSSRTNGATTINISVMGGIDDAIEAITRLQRSGRLPR